MKVVIVDDEPEVLTMAAKMVKKNFSEYEVAPFGKPEGALDYSADILLTDYNLHASMTGLDLIKKYKANSPKTHCILMSGGEDTEEAKKYAAEFGIDFLHKPFAMEELVGMLKGETRKPVGVNYGSNIGSQA